DVVLGGTVVDDREQPIPHARVTLARRVPWTEGTRRMEGERILALRKWPGLALTPLAETRADASGVFALRGEWDAPPEPYVFADADGHAASRPTPLAGPSSGLVLVAP